MSEDKAIAAIEVDEFFRCYNQKIDLENGFLNSDLNALELAVAVEHAREPILYAALLFEGSQLYEFAHEVAELLGEQEAIATAIHFNALGKIAQAYGLEPSYGIIYVHEAETQNLDYATVMLDNLPEAIRSGKQIDIKGYLSASRATTLQSIIERN